MRPKLRGRTDREIREIYRRTYRKGDGRDGSREGGQKGRREMQIHGYTGSERTKHSG